MTDTLTTRQNIRMLLGRQDLEYFDRLCSLEDADETSAIDAGRRYTALEHAVKVSHDVGTAIAAAEKFMAFLRGDGCLKTDGIQK